MGWTLIIVRNLPIPPSANALTRNAGSKRVKTPAYAQWIAQAGWIIQAMPASHRQTIHGTYTLEIIAQRPRANRDIDNIIKPINDLLKRHKLIEDDKFCVRVSAKWDGVGDLVRIIVLPTKA